MIRGIILYGPPASGKDTITTALGGKFAMVPRLKAGPGRTIGYRMVTDEDLAALRATPGAVLWETQRYSANYMLTKADVLATAESAIPVVHVGETTAIDAVTHGVPELSWRIVELRCARDVAIERIAARSTEDDAERIARYDDTPYLEHADLVLDTSAASPTEAARQIIRTIAPSIVVPAPTFQTSQESVDRETTVRYAAALAESWVPYVLVNGPMGRGEHLGDTQRATNLDLWVRTTSPRRIIAACWTDTDLADAHDRGGPPLVMLQATNERILDWELRQLPTETWIYANPRYSATLAPEDIAAYNVAGVKLSKITLDHLRAMRAANPRSMILHGSSRDIQASL